MRNDAMIRRRLERVREKYRLARRDPSRCIPLMQIEPDGKRASNREQYDDAAAMLEPVVEIFRRHLETVDDDFLPYVRVEFGTVQVASAFGVPVRVLEETPPAAGAPVLATAGAVRELAVPSPEDAGIFPRVWEFRDYLERNRPSWLAVQHPDIQSPFNTAHLIRGDGIFTDFYDSPDDARELLRKVTDFMILLARKMASRLRETPGWFVDWGGLWEGAFRICNCSMQMISPEFYRSFVLPEDRRFFEAVGGGRLHYCGRSAAVLREFFAIPGLSCIDFDSRYCDPWRAAREAPENMPLWIWVDLDSKDPIDKEVMRRLLSEERIPKRNMVYRIKGADLAERQAVARRLQSV
ncbi:MAG: uroporphyrinogen decarboxylase family protein [Planctomycetota bacterium]